MGIKNCPNCGKELPNEATFCPYCMQRIDNAVVVEPEKGSKKISSGVVAVAVILVAIIALIPAFVSVLKKNVNKKANTSVDDTRSSESSYLIEDTSNLSEIYNYSTNNVGEVFVNPTQGHANAVTPNVTNRPTVSSQTTTRPNNVQPTTVRGATTTKAPVTTKPANTTRPANTTKPSNTTCSHNWQAVTQSVYHDEVGHYETVSHQRTVTKYKCPICWKDFESLSSYYSHFDSKHTPSYDGDPITALRNQYTTSSDYETYTTNEWVVDKPAYTENVVTGYVCSICGARK